MKSLDAIVLAGNSNKGYIQGIPKCFKDFTNGCSIVEEEKKINSVSNVINALNKAESIKSITLIGPNEMFDNLRLSALNKNFLAVPQNNNANFADNLFNAYENATKLDSFRRDPGFLYLSGDTPFRTPYSIDFAVQNVKDSDDLTLFMMRESDVKKLFFVYQKPLLPLVINNEFIWCKPDDMVFVRPSKLPKEKIEFMYEKRSTNRLTWALEFNSILNEYKEIKDIIFSGWALKQWHRLTKNLPEGINSPSFMKKKLEKTKVEEISRLYPLNMSSSIVITPFIDGYIDIDNENDYLNISKNYRKIRNIANTDILQKYKDHINPSIYVL